MTGRTGPPLLTGRAGSASLGSPVSLVTRTGRSRGRLVATRLADLDAPPVRVLQHRPQAPGGLAWRRHNNPARVVHRLDHGLHRGYAKAEPHASAFRLPRLLRVQLEDD